MDPSACPAAETLHRRAGSLFACAWLPTAQLLQRFQPASWAPKQSGTRLGALKLTSTCPFVSLVPSNLGTAVGALVVRVQTFLTKGLIGLQESYED